VVGGFAVLALMTAVATTIVAAKTILREIKGPCLGEHKLCKTPANQCTLTLLPF
jgi:hypothetical protein